MIDTIFFQAYGQSKLANILFTKELARRGEGSRVDFFSLHPGSVKTDIFRHNKQTMNCCFNLMFKPFLFLMKTPESGAQTSLHCILEDGLVSGGYYSACREVRPTTLQMEVLTWVPRPAPALQPPARRTPGASGRLVPNSRALERSDVAIETLTINVHTNVFFLHLWPLYQTFSWLRYSLHR